MRFAERQYGLYGGAVGLSAPAREDADGTVILEIRCACEVILGGHKFTSID